jgi:predicted trehalose synthase
MTEQDAFGRDSQVRYMRRVFAQIEKAQNILLEKIGMTCFDERLRHFREMALKLFEKTWAMAVQKGIVENEEDAATLYLYCLSYALSTRGIALPSNVLPEHKEIQKFVKEVLK